MRRLVSNNLLIYHKSVISRRFNYKFLYIILTFLINTNYLIRLKNK